MHVGLLGFLLVLFYVCVIFFFCKQKTVYEMRISDWSSDVCSSDLRSPCTRADASSTAPSTAAGNSAAGRCDGPRSAAGRWLARDWRWLRSWRGGTRGREGLQFTKPRHAGPRWPGTRQDRNSAVSGRIGSGLLEISGGRFIKK